MIGRRRLDTESFQNVMMGTETHENHQATSTRRRLNPLITGWNFVKNILTDLDEAAGKLLIMAKEVDMGLPDWALNVVTALQAIISKGTGGRRLGEVSCSSDEFEPKTIIDKIVCGWNNLIMPCLKDFGNCMAKIGGMIANFMGPAFRWIVKMWNWAWDTAKGFTGEFSSPLKALMSEDQKRNLKGLKDINYLWIQRQQEKSPDNDLFPSKLKTLTISLVSE